MAVTLQELGYKVSALSINYGQRHAFRENLAAMNVVTVYRIPLQIIGFDALRSPSALRKRTFANRFQKVTTKPSR